ncbi:RNA polymerase sigma factor [Candidatus Riflebacteria bacterium]
MAFDSQKEKVPDLVYVNQFLDGDESAFNYLVDAYYKKIYNLTYRFFNNPDDATDATQEIFLKSYKYLEKFRQDSSFYTWLHRLAINHCITAVNSKKRFFQKCKEYFSLTFLPRLDRPVYDPVKLVEEKEFYSDLKIAISKLPTDFRIVVILRDMEGYSYEEIAEKLGISLGTVKSRISRGRRILRGMLVHHRGEI